MPMQGILASAGMKPTTPTIGTATDGGTGTTVSVAFTPSTYIGKGTITYTATSSPGSLTGTGSSSPITVSGLTTGTAYTFTVKGTTNYGVVSNSSAASNSVTPASPTSFDSIATFTPTSGSSFTFSSIASTYKSLQIRINAIATTSTGADLKLSLNGDTALSFHRLTGNGSSATAQYFNDNEIAGTLVGLSTQYPFAVIVDIIDYASTSKYKTVRVFNGTDENGSGEIDLRSLLWQSTAAVNSVTIGTNGVLTTGTKIALYGIK